MDSNELRNITEEPVFADDKDSEFLTGNITTMFWKYALLGLVGSIVSNIAVFLDGVFMGNGVGEMALAGIAVAISFMYFMLGTVNMFGLGASTLAGIKLGKGEVDEARKVYGSTITFMVITTILLAIIVLIFIEPILRFLGATETILPYAKNYAVWFWPCFPVMCVGFVAYFFCRLAEKPTAAMIGFVFAGLAAIVVEYMLVFKFHWGTAASALDCVIGIAGMIVLIPYMQIKKNVFTLTWADMKLNWGYAVESMKIGFPMLVVNLCPLLTTVVINRQLIAYGGNDLHIAAFGIFNAYIVYIMTGITNAFAQGLQPIASVNYGANQFDRLIKLIKSGIGQSFLAMLGLQLIVMIFAKPIVGMFTAGSVELTEITVHAMRLFILLYAFGNIATLVGGYYIGIEKIGLALLNSTTRVVIFAVPMLFIIPAIMGVNGVWLAQPIADVFACGIAIGCMIHEMKVLKAKEHEFELMGTRK